MSWCTSVRLNGLGADFGRWPGRSPAQVRRPVSAFVYRDLFRVRVAGEPDLPALGCLASLQCLI